MKHFYRDLLVRQFPLLLIMTFPVVFMQCEILGEEPVDRVFEYDFRKSDHNWEAFFTNYNVGWGEKMELTSDYRNLPEPLNTEEKGLFISGINNSDDLKMLFRRKVNGLEPNTTYKVGFTIRFATNAPSECAGIGGAPGESVKVIAASSKIKPEPFIGEEGNNDYYLLNVRHQNDSQAWYQGAIMGNIANSRTCEQDPEFELKELTSGTEHSRVTTGDNGEAWLLFGTRSGFEGQTGLYYTYFKAEFRE